MCPDSPETFPKEKQPESLFSILIPSWNNLAYLRNCITGIRKNSSYEHEIIVHVNDGADGTLNWIKSAKIEHSFSKDNIGICRGINAAAKLATGTYFVYMNDDMYVCPSWDFYLKEEIESHLDNHFFLSSTMIEPRESGNPCVIAPCDFGTSVEEFQETKLLREFQNFQKKDWSGASWPPNLVHRNLWNEIGGFSEEFSPGYYSDPDFAMKLWKAGVRYFKGVGRSKVYHFQSKSLGRMKKNAGRKQFYKKWKISPAYFYKNYLKMGTGFNGKLEEPPRDFRLFLEKLKSCAHNFF